VIAGTEGSGAGSEFSVRLPIADPVADSTRAPDAGQWIGGAQRILLADDNRDSLESLALLLELQGNEVRTAPDGAHAVAEAERFRPDVALLDVGMPRMNGYDACRQIRAQEWGRNMLLVALTGWGQEADRARSQEAGFDQHFVKPVDPKVLLRYLDKHSAKREELKNAAGTAR